MNTKDEDGIGVVFRKSTGHYTVQTHGRELDCSLSSLIHKQLIYSTADPSSMRPRVQAVREIEHVDPVAIGDRVRYVEASGIMPRPWPASTKRTRSPIATGSTWSISRTACTRWRKDVGSAVG